MVPAFPGLPRVIAAAALTLASTAASAQDGTEVQLRQRIEELEQKLQRLEQRLEQQAAPATSSQSVSSADSTSAPSVRETALQERVETLDQEVRVLGRKQELEREAAAAKAKESATVFAGHEGFGIRSADNAFQLRFRGTVQADSRWFLNEQADADQRNQFLLRRVRPVLEGTLYEKFGFRIMPEFAGGSFQLLDAYVDANLTPEFRLRIGKMKGPVDWERLQSPANLLMMERAFPTQLAPNRDIGLQVWGDVMNGALSYQLGLFNGTVDGSSVDGDANNGKDIEGRLIASPFRNGDSDLLRGLRFGVAYSTGTQEGTTGNNQLPRFLTPGQNTFFAFNSGAFADGNRTRIAPQFYYSYGPLGLFGQYIVSDEDVERAGNRRNVANTGWHLTASYVLTGEDATLDGVRPRRPFNFKSGDWGAFEVAARVSELDVDDDVFAGSAAQRLANPDTQAGKATEYGLGLSWYLNRSYRVMLNYEHTQFDGGAPSGGDRETERVIMTRFQLAL